MLATSPCFIWRAFKYQLPTPQRYYTITPLLLLTDQRYRLYGRHYPRVWRIKLPDRGVLHPWPSRRRAGKSPALCGHAALIDVSSQVCNQDLTDLAHKFVQRVTETKLVEFGADGGGVELLVRLHDTHVLQFVFIGLRIAIYAQYR